MNSRTHPTLAKLLGLIDSSPGFSGLGASVKIISCISDADDGGIKEITTAILRDAALTARLLRLANSSRNALSGGAVSTIDQAVAILGLNTVRSAALSLTLLDCLSRKPQSNQLHAEIVAAYFCGCLAAEITRCNSPESGPQESQVCGLLQNLGRMMAIYHLYEAIESSRALQAEKNLTEDEAVTQILGVGFEAMGASIAHHWNLPSSIEEGIAAKIDRTRPRMPPNLGWNQICALFSRRVTDALFRLPENQEKTDIDNNIRLFSSVLQLKEEDIQEWIGKALEETSALLAEIAFPCNITQARNLLRKSSERVVDRLSAQDSLIKKDVLQPNKKTPMEIFQQALRVIHEAYGFDRTLLCVPQGASDLVAVVGVGRNALQIAAKFRCSGNEPDIFRLALNRQVDMYIADTSAPTIAAYIPAWYREQVGAPAFMLLSLAHEGMVLGLLYGDYAEPPAESPQSISSQEQVKEWRGQMQMALLSRMGKPSR